MAADPKNGEECNINSNVNRNNVNRAAIVRLRNIKIAALLTTIIKITKNLWHVTQKQFAGNAGVKDLS